MDKYPLIGVCICTVVLLILGSLSNVVGYQTVQSSNQKTINDVVDQKELLFQTIVDIAHNKEIQRLIFKSQLNKEGFFNSYDRFPLFNTPALTKNHLKQMYLIGLILSKYISKSKIHTMFEQYQIYNLRIEKEITVVIEKDATFKAEIAQLSDSKCDCENENTISWNFPVICILLIPLLILAWVLFYPFGHGFLLSIMTATGEALNCFWIR